MELDKNVDDDGTTEHLYTGADILTAIEEGDTLRVPDRLFKADFEVTSISSNEYGVYYSAENPNGAGFDIMYDPTARMGQKVTVGQGNYKVNFEDITLVR